MGYKDRKRRIRWRHEACYKNLGEWMFVIFDTETTGFGEADIVELASIIILDNGERHQFRQLMKPEFPIHPKASEVHGISNEEVANLPSSKKVVTDWLTYVKSIAEKHQETEIVFGAHNLPFDVNMISRHVSLESEKASNGSSPKKIASVTNVRF